MKLNSIKIQLIIFLSLWGICLSVVEKDVMFLLSVSIAVASAIMIDSIITYIKTKKLIITKSSVISGLIIGFVLSGDKSSWLLALASLFAIGSKHLIRIGRRHLFNPAAVGVFLVTLLFGATTQWKGTYHWYIIMPFGLYFIYKIQKLEVLLGYGLTALTLFGIQAGIQKASLLNIFGYLNYFFIFFMLIEPNTTPVKPLAKIVFGIGVAVLIFILTEIGVRFDTELLSLLFLNLFVSLLNKIPSRKEPFMKKITTFIIICFFLAICTIAEAHPPTDIKITYDATTKTLSAVITHPVSNPESHFIKKVDIALNGQEIIEHKISKQDNNTTQTVGYLICDVKAGDALSVEAYCSISGKLEKETKVTAQ